MDAHIDSPSRGRRRDRRPAGHDGSQALRTLVALTLSLTALSCTRTCEICQPKVEPIVAPSTCGNADEITFSKIKAAISGAEGPPEVLLLSGGGSYGAWGAGFLNGWSDPSAPSVRPKFEVVTGSSTGAILGTWAFIGPRADPCAKCAYTQTDDDDVYVKTFPWMWLQPWRWHEIKPWVSVKNLAPLRGMLKLYTSIDEVEEVARIYRDEGRVFLVGTVDIDLSGFCLWDMGKLAAPLLTTKDEAARQKVYDRYIDVITASCSNPIVFNPTYIDGDMHVDGGVRHQIFSSALLNPIIINGMAHWTPKPMADGGGFGSYPGPPGPSYCTPCSSGPPASPTPSAAGAGPSARSIASVPEPATAKTGSTTSASPFMSLDSDCIAGGKDGRPQVYAIVNGPMVTPRVCTSEDIYNIGQRAMTVMEIQAMVGNLYQAREQYTPKMPGDTRWNFCVTHIPNETEVWPYADTFPKAEMQALFAQAEEKAKSADPWLAELPGGGVSPLPCKRSVPLQPGTPAAKSTSPWRPHRGR
jgi:Patatin-like phospholipase